MIRNFVTIIIVLLMSMVMFAGCYQGRPSKDEPIHINPNMDNQPKYRPQSESGFFADGATMRIPPEGTVAIGELRADDEYYRGKNSKGEFIKSLPSSVMFDMNLLKRGQERFNIYCSPCHGRVGDGKGIVPARGMLPPPTFHSELIRNYPDGQIFDVISNGVRNMPAYRFQIPVADRWAIVAYFRTLQRSQNATIEDVPEQHRGSITQ